MIPPVSWTGRAEGEYPPPVISLCLTQTNTWNRQGTRFFFHFWGGCEMGEDFQKCIKRKAIKYRPGGVKPAATLQALQPVWPVWWYEDKERVLTRGGEGRKVSIMQSTPYTADSKNGKHTAWQREEGTPNFLGLSPLYLSGRTWIHRLNDQSSSRRLKPVQSFQCCGCSANVRKS